VRQLRVWVKEGNDWKIAAAQATLVAQQPSKWFNAESKSGPAGARTRLPTGVARFRI